MLSEFVLSTSKIQLCTCFECKPSSTCIPNQSNPKLCTVEHVQKGVNPQALFFLPAFWRVEQMDNKTQVQTSTRKYTTFLYLIQINVSVRSLHKSSCVRVRFTQKGLNKKVVVLLKHSK